MIPVMLPFTVPSRVGGFVLEVIHATSRVPRCAAIVVTQSPRSSFHAAISQMGFRGGFSLSSILLFAPCTDESAQLHVG